VLAIGVVPRTIIDDSYVNNNVCDQI
jgi:hypothetical protein